MPKRSAEEKIKRYHDKIRKLEAKRKRRPRIIVSSDEDEADIIADKDGSEITRDSNPIIEEINTDKTDQENNINTSEEQEPDLDPELVLALGESTSDTPDFGEKILESQAKLWSPLLLKGMPKENKDKLLKEYLIPNNCKLLQAPNLNAEIAAAIPDMVRNRDKNTLKAQQQQLGSGITAINRAMDILLQNGDKIQSVKHLSNACRLLSDLHCTFTQYRTKLITPSLDKTCLNVIQDAVRDENLFGEKLAERIKSAKAIEKQGLQIKKIQPQKSSNTSQSTTGAYRHSYQGNWQGPPRYPSNRGGRGGSRRQPPSSTVVNPRRNTNINNQRNAQSNRPRAPPN